MLVLWEVLALRWLSPRHLAPTPVAVVAALWHHPGLALWPNLVTTFEEAAVGWVAGNAAGTGLAVAFVLVPAAEAALSRVALASYCMPVIAIAPILDAVLSGIAPAAVLAALSVVFTTLIGTLVGLRSADAASLDLVRASDFDFLWAAVILITLFAFLVCNVVGTGERLVFSRYHEA